MNYEEEADPAPHAFREFALACRVERDRVAHAHLNEADRRFESSPAERAAAEVLALSLIAAARRASLR